MYLNGRPLQTTVSHVELPKVGDVYETALPGVSLLLCVHVRRLTILEGLAFDFLVLDGERPEIRTWANHEFSDVTMESTMRRFQFKVVT